MSFAPETGRGEPTEEGRRDGQPISVPDVSPSTEISHSGRGEWTRHRSADGGSGNSELRLGDATSNHMFSHVNILFHVRAAMNLFASIFILNTNAV